MVYRVYVEKRAELAHEAASLRDELTTFLGIKGLENVRLFNRYDAENIEKEVFDGCIATVFSEPQLDIVSFELPTDARAQFAVEFLPGQFDQRADSAAQCIQLITQGERPTIASAKVYLLYGDLTDSDIDRIIHHVINPVEARRASLELPETLAQQHPNPTEVDTLEGFIAKDEEALKAMLKDYGLAMDLADLKFCQDYFKSENRDPSITELRVIDTYWSDHCRHTTFLTTIDKVTFADPLLQETFEDYIAVRKELNRTKPVNLMDIGTIAGKILRKRGMLARLDESEEINACTVKIDVDVNGVNEEWLLLFKNETHNHPTEIEPFGGAATCIGGAIRDPLSGRSYVYAAMRVTGAADPLRPVEETMVGKLPQRKLVTSAAAGYSSYGNQIGLATGCVDEIYHDGYAAKHMEVGAVIAAAPARNVRRERPDAGDVVILLGGRTGRDGCGGATGSSKSHTTESLSVCGAEVQKGNAPEERKLQRLFRNAEASLMIKRCNDFGAGGVSVAIGELADGLDIDLNAVPKKYAGLDGTELAISESQERMAVVVEEKDVERFMALAAEENLEATVVARVKADPRMTMVWNGKNVVDLSREFLNSNGAEKHMEIEVTAAEDFNKAAPADFADGYMALASDLNVCSKRGLGERFDASIGAGSVFMPFGGKRQMTPTQAMVHKIPLEKGVTETCSYMSWGYNPFLSEKSPYHGAYLAVVESAAKLVAGGADFKEVYLSFQEYFPKPGTDPKRWGQPMAALLGAFRAQTQLGIAAIGGKDSMSGSFEKLDVPPTLISFAVTPGKIPEVISPEFKFSGSKVIWLRPEMGEDGLPKAESLLAVFSKVRALCEDGVVSAMWTPGFGGVAEGVMKMCFGNGLGFEYEPSLTLDELFGYSYGSFIMEVADEVCEGTLLGYTTEEEALVYGETKVSMADVFTAYEAKLASVYPATAPVDAPKPEAFSFKAASYGAPAVKSAKPTVVIPVFPGTNCEYDAARVLEAAGAKAEIMVINNLTASGVARSVEAFAAKVKAAQMIFIPGGFSGGDEPDGSGKFITAFFRNAAVCEATMELLEKRDGLMAGICNGFQALIKLGLVPYGKIMETDANCPTLTYNCIGRHQSRLVRTRIASNKSPWLRYTNVGDVYTVPISHGEGRFLASDELVASLAANGQIATQYVDMNGDPTYDILYNPNGSVAAIEGITSPDGRVFGKMGHSERIGNGLYRNVPGEYDMGMFRAAVDYFK